MIPSERGSNQHRRETRNGATRDRRWQGPLLREGKPIGAILIRRMEVRPFYQQADRAGQELCHAGRDRHRECAAAQ